MRTDIHTHFFTSGMMGEGLERFISTLRLREALERLPWARERTEAAANPLALFLRDGLTRDGAFILSEMDAAAGEAMAYCPLMMDIEYLDEAAETRLPGGGDRLIGRLRDTLSAWKASLHGHTAGKSDAALETVTAWVGEAEERIQARTRDLRPDLVDQASFESQLETLAALKGRHPDRIFPFLGIDPRRDAALGGRLLELIGDRVGRGKTFAGIKLYPPMGFSPTDPFLFGPGGFYEFAQRNDLPVTVHFSAAGFGAMVDRVRVAGDIYDDDSGDIVPADRRFAGGIVEFEHSIINIRQAVPERIRVLNHPKLWAKVLSAYPALRLNLAHFGGFGRIHPFMEGNARGHWTAFALKAITDYPKVHTDLSGWHEHGDDPHSGHSLAQFVQRVYGPLPEAVRAKFLYGSDWFILSLKDPDLAAYLDRFRAAFAAEWDRISIRNPEGFLAPVR
jgi:predicted TIM-barrel fold metal-dependent hydrolase